MVTIFLDRSSHQKDVHIGACTFFELTGILRAVEKIAAAAQVNCGCPNQEI
jgi:hypothetical protein